MPAEKSIKEMSTRELRDKGNKAVEEARKLYEDRKGGEEITKDRENQVDLLLAETDEIEKEMNLRRLEVSLAAEGPKIPGTETESDEKFDPNFKPDMRKVNQ